MAKSLMQYDIALRALAEAKTLKEVHAIRNQAISTEELARRMRNKDMEAWAFELRIRAEREFGRRSRILEKTGPRGGRPKKHGNVATFLPPTKKQALAELGVNERHANRCEKLAAITEDDAIFEEKLAEVVERIKNPPKRRSPKEVDPETTRRMLEHKTQINAKRAAYERRVEIAECVFSACREIEKVHCAPQEWLNEVSEGHLEDVPEKVLPIIDWLNEARKLYERRRGQEPVASVDKEGGPKLQIVGG